MKSPGERLFSAYLRQRKLPFDYERLVGARRPDFVVDHPDAGEVACDVYEPQLRLPSTGGAFSSYSALRGAVEDRKYDQAKAVREAGLPFVVVLRHTNSDIPFDPVVVAGAMFGDLAVEFSVWLGPGPSPNEGRPRARTVFGGGGRLQPSLNRAVSAVAILTSFNPTMWRVQGAYRRQLDRIEISRRSLREQCALAELINNTYDHFRSTGLFDDEARLARLTVLHNPHCDIPLAPEVFGGPHDCQWAHIEIGEGLGCTLVAQGRLRWEVPK